MSKPRSTGVILWVSMCLVTTTLTACTTRWENSKKSPEQAAADETACTQRAEQNALLRAGKPRVDYMFGRPNAMPGMSRGETPMEMVERTRTEGDYGRDFDGCMIAKGYVRAGRSK